MDNILSREDVENYGKLYGTLYRNLVYSDDIQWLQDSDNKLNWLLHEQKQQMSVMSKILPQQQ